jgi:hypothetical protein
VILVISVLLLALAPQPGAAQGSWLDGARASWNAPGMDLPAAPQSSATGIPQCQGMVRAAETAEDNQVTARGWQLYGAYQRGWGITLVGGSLGFDAMCRPVPYQQFVFVDGAFAGTLAPAAMYPRTDGALTDAGIPAEDRVFAIYDRYAPTDPLCCPSGAATITFAVQRTASGPVVTPDVASPVQPSASPTPAATGTASQPAGATAYPVCVGLGGDALSLVYWTAEKIAAQEARSGPVVRAHPETGTCRDPAGLPLRASVSNVSWVCSRTAADLWYGPVWTADIYLAPDAVPPDPAIGGCPRPRDPAIPPPPESELAAATAVYLSQLEAAGDLDTLYAWLHPDAQAVIPEAAVTGWYNAEWLPRGPGPIVVTSVDFGEWTWDVTGVTYPHVAEIAYEQTFADGSVVNDTVRLVQDDQGMWRWFFGRDRAFVDEQIALYANQASPEAAG